MKIKIVINEEPSSSKESGLACAFGRVHFPKKLKGWEDYMISAYGYADNYLWAASRLIYNIGKELLGVKKCLKQQKGIELKFKQITHEIEIELVEDKKGG